MKWLVLICLICSVFAALAENAQERDFTSHYAELASAVPSHVDVADLLVSLRAAQE